MSKTVVKTEKGVTVISSEIVINISKEKVWGVLKPIGEIGNFHPLIKKSHATTDKKSGLGAQRRCELFPMGTMEEKVVEWDEGKSYVMAVIGGKMLPPYRFMKGKIELIEDNNKTKVTFYLFVLFKIWSLWKIDERTLNKTTIQESTIKICYRIKKNMLKNLSN